MTTKKYRRIPGFVIILPIFFVQGCSFRGGSVPAHLTSISIAEIDDASGYGDGQLRQRFQELLVRRFREDNSLRVVGTGAADSRLETTITTIRDDIRASVGPGELETNREVVIDVRVTVIDNVKRRPLYSARTFTGRSQYPVSLGAEGRTRALQQALDDLCDAILLATVADW